MQILDDLTCHRRNVRTSASGKNIMQVFSRSQMQTHLDYSSSTRKQAQRMQCTSTRSAAVAPSESSPEAVVYSVISSLQARVSDSACR